MSNTREFKYDQSLRFLCAEVENFRYISRNLIFPETKRIRILIEHAENLNKAAETFIREASKRKND